LIERGRASAEALALVAAAWRGAGADGRDLYVLQHLKELVDASVRRVAGTKIEELAVVDGGNGESFTAAVASFPAAVAEVLQKTGVAIGVDIARLLRTADAKGAEA
jgi:flotillin